MNLLLISIDSLRLDHVSRTSPSINTPRFDAVTQAFEFSERCFSVSSATRPVHLSLLSGLYPFEHGVEGQRCGRQRMGIPLLTRLLHQAGYQIALFSEAATVFTGLDLGAPVRDLDPRPSAGGAQLAAPLAGSAARGTCVLAHYWQAHTPYGAADGLAMGETLALLRAGRPDVVRQRYAAAVTDLLENKVAPAIEACDLGRWCVLIFGDHGESWDDEEPYHGETLRNSVLRVPLYLHVPFHGRPVLGDHLLSLVDAYPTLCRILDLPRDPRQDGRAWAGRAEDALYLAQITPSGAGPGTDLPGLEGALQPPPATRPRRWAAFDPSWKYRWEEGGNGQLEETLSGQPARVGAGDERIAHLLEGWQGHLDASPYTQRPLTGGSEADQRLLEQRLRDLGYL